MSFTGELLGSQNITPIPKLAKNHTMFYFPLSYNSVVHVLEHLSSEIQLNKYC